jgi:hypothetical protein
MRRRTFIISLITSSFVAVNHASAWVLITKEESERESTAPRRVQAPSAAQPGAPTIEVDQPDNSKPINSPVTIKISFHPQQGATIDVQSFRATYGFLAIDITQRIIANAQLTASGMTANNAQIPPGQYEVTLQIADNFHRVGTRTIDFTVL